MQRKRLVLPFVIAAILPALLVAPVRNRITQSTDHFFISGGRSVIWDVGSELASRYPLGIGFKNSPILRDFSKEIPKELRHFHNNILNVLVETGWVSCAIFLWWIASLLSAAFRARTNEADIGLSKALGCAILSWQVAGLVEYNIGDKEVVLIAMLLIGTLSSVQRNRINGDSKGTR